MKAVITGEKRRASEGTWISGGGMELPCIYHIYAPKTPKNTSVKNYKTKKKSKHFKCKIKFTVSLFPYQRKNTI